MSGQQLEDHCVAFFIPFRCRWALRSRTELIKISSPNYKTTHLVPLQVTSLLKNEGVRWTEENQGTILIKLEGPREFSFLDSGSDCEQ